MGILATLRRILRWNKAVGGPAAPGSEQKSLDTALIIEAARFVVTRRLASKTVLMRHLVVTGAIADQLLAKLEHCEVIAAVEPGQARRVLRTSGQLPGVIADFERRARDEPEASERA